MPSITEVPIPVRFLFILLGPKTADLDYHEVGRSIATLMSNRHFHNIAYKADDRKELLSGKSYKLIRLQRFFVNKLLKLNKG